MSDQDEDARRIRQLEEARKRVEELKKKNKKGKKNKTKKNAQGHDSKSTELADDSVTEDQADDTPELEETPEDTPKGRSIDVREDKVEQKREAPNNKEGDVPPVRGDNEETAKPLDDNEEDSIEHEESQVPEKTQVASEQTSVDNKKSQEATELFGDEQDTFLTTIEKEKENLELENLRNQLQNSLLDNKKLKFINMDQETEIEELQNELEELNEKFEAAEKELASVKSLLSEKEQELKLPVMQQQNQQIEFTPFNTSNTSRQVMATENNLSQLNIDRAALDKWRNWNVDMTTWRSIGSGPIVEY